MTMFNLFSGNNEAFGQILEFLNKDQLLSGRKDGLIEDMSKAFSEYSSQSEIAFEELERLIENEPQLIIDSVEAFFTHRRTLTKMMASGRRRRNVKTLTVMDKLSDIADIYECISMLQLPAYLFSRRKAKYQTLTEPSAVLKHFKGSGLTAKNKDYLRLLRNATSHLFTIENDTVITEDGGRLSIAEIEELHQKFEQITSWWMTFCVYTLWYMPKFGFLVILGLISSFGNKSNSWNSFVEGMKRFYGDMIDEVEKETQTKDNHNKTKIKRLKKRFRHIVRYKILKKFEDRKADIFIAGNMPTIFEQVAYHLNYFVNEFNEIAIKLDNIQDRERIEKFSSWIHGIYVKVEEAAEIFKQHPEVVDIILKGKKLREKGYEKLNQN